MKSAANLFLGFFLVVGTQALAGQIQGMDSCKGASEKLHAIRSSIATAYFYCGAIRIGTNQKCQKWSEPFNGKVQLEDLPYPEHTGSLTSKNLMAPLDVLNFEKLPKSGLSDLKGEGGEFAEMKKNFNTYEKIARHYLSKKGDNPRYEAWMHILRKEICYRQDRLPFPMCASVINDAKLQLSKLGSCGPTKTLELHIEGAEAYFKVFQGQGSQLREHGDINREVLYKESNDAVH